MTGGGSPANGPCPEYEALLEDFLEGKLETSATERVAKHLQDCRVCRMCLANTAKSVFLLKQLREPWEGPAPGFARRAMGAIRAVEERLAEEKSFWKPLEILAWRVTMAATLGLVMLLAYATLPSFSPRQHSDMPRMTEQDIFPDPVQQPANRDEVLLMVAETTHGR